MASIDAYNEGSAPVEDTKGKSSSDLTRRGFISNILSAAAIGGVAGASYLKSTEGGQGRDGEVPQDEASTATESIEPNSSMQEMFEGQVEAMDTFYNLRFNEVIFVDDYTGRALAGPIKLEDVIIDTPNGRKRISVGKFDENGLIQGGISGSWLNYQRELLGVDNLPTKALNVTKAFEKFIKRDDEPEFQQLIRVAARGERGGIATLKDVTRYFGNNPNRPVEGDPQGRPLMQYLYEEVEFNDSNKGFKIPELTKGLLREYLIGIATHESRYIPATSQAGAGGILQFMPDTQEAYINSGLTGFGAEVAGVGPYMVDNYGYLDHWMKSRKVMKANGEEEAIPQRETYEHLRAIFGSEEDWQRYFYLPCLITAYNAGALNVGQALHKFVESFDQAELEGVADGGDNFGLFYYFTLFARQDNSDKYMRECGPSFQKYFAGVKASTDMLKR